jgi:carotenoid cleavage dioxygenase
MFGYNFVEPYLTYHQVDSQGVLQRSEPIELPASPMMHDFAITENYVIFMDLPILFKLDLAIAGDAFPFRWDDAHTARLGVMPRDGGNADIQWFEIDPCYVFHVMNAHEDPAADGVLVLEAARHERLWVDGPNALDGTPLLHRWRIDTTAGSVSMEQLDDRMVEFPQHDWRRTGRPYRYGYGLVLNAPMGDSLGGASAIMKMDHDTGATATHELRASESTDEAIFVPAGADAGEDEGYLLSYVYDRAEDRTSVLVADASDMGKPPVARIHLPTRVPFGFHGFWVPAGG